MVRIHPDPPDLTGVAGWIDVPAAALIETRGAVAQLGEHLLCKQGVVGSIPISSTMEPIHAAEMEWPRDQRWMQSRERLPPASIFAIERSLTIEYGL